jgi:hypothetical protein
MAARRKSAGAKSGASRAKRSRASAKNAAGRAGSAPPIGDEAVAAKTGRDWAQWVMALDRAGARAMTHKDTAAMLHRRFGVGDWWSQMVTVGYERITGKRAALEQAGGFTANASLTVGVDVAALFDAAADPARQRDWLPSRVTVHRQSRPKSIRATDGSGGKTISLMFYPKGEGKSQVTAQQEKLATQDDALRLKKTWAASLRKLAALVGG